MSLSDTLARGIDTLGLTLSDDQQRLLLAYFLRPIDEG